MAVRSSDAAGRFAALLNKGPLRRLRERRAARAQRLSKTVSRVEDGAPQLAAAADASPALASAAETRTVAVEAPEREQEAALPTRFATGTAEHMASLDLAGTPRCKGGLAPRAGFESQDSSVHAVDAVTLGVVESDRDAPYLCGIPISRAALDVATYVPYLNAATNKPCYIDSPAPTSAPNSREGSFESNGDNDDDDTVLSVMDCGQAVPYLEGMLNSSAAADVAEHVPYLTAATGKACYMDSLAQTAAFDSQGSLGAEVMVSSDAAPYLDRAPTPRCRACPYLQ